MSSKRAFKRGDVVDIQGEYRDRTAKHMLVLGYFKRYDGSFGVSVSYGRGTKAGDFVWDENSLYKVPRKYWNDRNNAIRRPKRAVVAR